jgi:hypothetical protein
MTLSIMTFRIARLNESIATLIIVALVPVFLCMVSLMLNVIFSECHQNGQCHYAECRNAECHYAEDHYAECHYAEDHYAECHYAECHSAECHYAELHYAKRHYAECCCAVVSKYTCRQSV